MKKQCVYCRQWNNQHRSLCQQKFGAINREGAHLIKELPQEEDSGINENALLSSGEMVLMQTATADISNTVTSQIQSVRMLLDTGSQRTYISEALAKKLSLKRVRYKFGNIWNRETQDTTESRDHDWHHAQRG